MKPYRPVQNALLMPLEGSMDHFASGVFSVDGTLAPESLHTRAVAAAPRPPEQHLKGAYIFGGYLFHHYGHFLLETLSRLYAVQQCACLPLLFMSPNDHIAEWQRYFFKYLNLANEILLVHEPTRVDTLIVSEAGSSVDPDFMLPEQLDALGRETPAERVPGKKLWLSRSRYMQQYSVAGGVINEREIEEQLRGTGWEIASFETLPVGAQVRHITSAEQVAGFDGSAFFTALLAKEVKGHFIVFGRRNRIAPAIPYMFSMKGVSFEQHVLPVTPTNESKGAESRFFLPDSQKLLDILAAASGG